MSSLCSVLPLQGMGVGESMRGDERECCASVGSGSNRGIQCPHTRSASLAGAGQGCRICLALIDFCFFAGNLAGSLPNVLDSPDLKPALLDRSLFCLVSSKLSCILAKSEALNRKGEQNTSLLYPLFSASRPICHTTHLIFFLLFWVVGS